MSEQKETITFKISPALAKQMHGIENRSDFIRTAILAALENSCPLCKGSGVLNPKRKEHWDDFSNKHRITECHTCCDEVKIECVR